jgi:hypothetical protein
MAHAHLMCIGYTNANNHAATGNRTTKIVLVLASRYYLCMHQLFYPLSSEHHPEGSINVTAPILAQPTSLGPNIQRPTEHKGKTMMPFVLQMETLRYRAREQTIWS